MQVRVFEHQRRAKSKGHPEGHGNTEREQEYADTMEYRGHEYFSPMEAAQSPVYCFRHLSSFSKAAIEYVLIHDDTNSVIDQTFAKDDSIELWVDLVLLKDGQNCYRIRCRECGTESQAFNQG